MATALLIEPMLSLSWYRRSNLLINTRCSSFLQKPFTRLSDWLQHPGERVKSYCVPLLMARVKFHYPDWWEKHQKALEQSSMPALLFSDLSKGLNPALLTLLHAAVSSTATWLPTPTRTLHPTPTPTRALNAPVSIAEPIKHKLGEVWWIFDRQLLLAEVFEKGQVPCGRLPYLLRDQVKGKHVARLLGNHSKVKLLGSAGLQCLFTTMCEPQPPTDLCCETCADKVCSGAATCDLNHLLSSENI